MSSPIPLDQIKEHDLQIDPVGVISEILNNLSDSRDIIRELLSNSCAKQVQASKIKIRIYESDMGLAITVEDDGIGMDYTEDKNNPGRLDKFLNIAQGKQSGHGSDEFGAKGFGSILLYNSKEVEIETWDGHEYAYRVILQNPRVSILEEKIVVKPVVYKIPSHNNPILKKGTKITIKGWSNIGSIPKDFKDKQILRYLKYYTVIGFTKSIEERQLKLPEFELYIGGNKKIIESGFDYIKPPEKGEMIKTIIYDNLCIEKLLDNGNSFKIVLKGGITTESKKNDLSDLTGGVWLSVNGIPYVKLPKNQWARKLNMTDDFIRFVVECDSVNLNLSRSDINRDEYYEIFKDALQDAFLSIRNDNGFQNYCRDRKKEFRIKLQNYMSEKKEEFLSQEKTYVWYNNRKLMGEPESEQDVSALLWILEGMQVLPFYHFQTLQYPGYQKGIDLLINIQEKEESEKKLCIYAELEKNFSNLIKHNHDISQMSCAFAWKVDKNKINIGKIHPTSIPYKYSYQLADSHIDVYEISSFPNIVVGTAPRINDN